MIEKTALYHKNSYYKTVDLIAADLTGLNKINLPRLVNSGKITEFAGNQVILPDRFTSKYGIKQRETITLRIGGQPVSLEVVEIAAYDTVFLRHTKDATALLLVTTLSGLLGQTDGYTKILAEPADDVSTSALKDELTVTISFFSLTMSVFIIYSSYGAISLPKN